MRRFCSAILAVVIAISVSGCTYETRIDKASIAETVTVQKGQSGFVYSFFMLSDSDETEAVSIEAPSFERACDMAKQGYIPDLSLTKLELFIVSEEVYDEILYDDVSFMATQYYISPIAYVAVADEDTMNFISKSKEAPEKIEKHIILKKNKERELNVNLLSIFNNFADNKNLEFNISYINSKEELRIIPFKLSSEK